MHYVHAKCEPEVWLLSQCWDSPMLRMVRPTTLTTLALVSPSQSTTVSPSEKTHTRSPSMCNRMGVPAELRRRLSGRPTCTATDHGAAVRIE